MQIEAKGNKALD